MARKPVAAGGAAKGADKKKDGYKLLDFVEARDWVGALTLLEWQRKTGEKTEDPLEWAPYCAFHLGDYKKAAKARRAPLPPCLPAPSRIGAKNSVPRQYYEEMLQKEGADPNLHTYLACCYFFLGMYKEADEEARKNPQGDDLPLQNRLMFHLAHKFNDEQRLMQHHQKLQDGSIEDQLCLASIHYLRSHYQEAIDVYKRFLLDHKEYLALNVYVALCYYKLDYFDVSHEVLNAYLQAHPDSALAINLKACNHFKSYNGKAGETELKRLTDLMTSTSHSFASDLVKHNMVVFRNGENALQVLPPLLQSIPEAQLNLVIYYLKNDEVEEAFQLIKDLEPTTPQEYTLKGVVYAAYGQKKESRENLKIAQQYFQLVGASPSECDTIPGRQCMASCFYLLRQFEDVLIYLNSIKSYFTNDDDFNWNYGVAKACEGDFRGAEEAFTLVQNEAYKSDYCYIGWLARCLIMNGKAEQAWEQYLKMETSPESFNLLQLIANDSYKTGAFYYSAKAFDVLERLDTSPEYWVGKRGACIGVFQQVIAGEESKEHLRDVVAMLRTSNNTQVEGIIKVMRKWAKENNVKL
eukprot:m51a1_g1876 putative tetratricopeptide repeat protein 26 (579) ;mRNA; f:677870-679968